MLKAVADTVLRWPYRPWRKALLCQQIISSACFQGNMKFTFSDSSPDSQKCATENKTTVDNLYKLSVNIKKIHRLKSWVLYKDVAYVEETANILKEMGASDITVANILESCPEAFLQEPAEINAQKSNWNLVCPKDEELITLIEKFPDSFFTCKSPTNQRDNIKYFQDLGLNNKIVSRLLTSAPQIFCNQVESNKKMVDALEENYLSLGGTRGNFKTWIMKLISQDPFVLSNTTKTMKENLKFLQDLGFHDEKVLKLLSKLKGFIFDLNTGTMEKGVLFTMSTFKCNSEELREMVIKCPALLYYSVPLLEERLQVLLREGASIHQVKECPNVLELTPQIVQLRARKIKQLGRRIQDQSIEVLNGTKKDFEVNYGKLQRGKERPLFNPVAPLHVEE
ncbi:transcription termination factor 2, mitochondrial [Bufo bufo]|uniref:transcription termination factor 2, mitochondrial n=1 Tax=Bufo bufo TaxID=8384 RepID=UPI001ABE7CB1|nr:transcription termination factor 2, mitochondrial [Bufo bufo]XP_040295434.1 transcription termination factor 2, mitochondrial [Bufo bufo]XP_040295444.1 transcription termination factor 2, mitochondrial [Bufo bufo]